MPLHRVPVEIAGQKRHAFHLVSIDNDYQAHRDTLVLTNPEDVIALLPLGVRDEWFRFLNELNQLTMQWHLRGVPTLKKVIRLYRKGEVLNSFRIATVVHHFGIVPALIIDEVDGLKVALLSERFGHGFYQKEPKEEEVIEVLQSLNEFLPSAFPAYYQQIANYLLAVFFTADERRALNFCLRVRNLIVGSIRAKIAHIEKQNYKSPRAVELAAMLANKYRDQLIEGRAVDALSHLIVNYIYGFFCLKHRAVEYNERLQGLSVQNDLFEPPSVALMKRCGENILDPDLDDDFVDAITGSSRPRETWLSDLAQASAFVAEIVRSTRGEYLDSPRIFVTYHFNVRDSERFFEQVSIGMRDRHLAARIIRGRHAGPNIRWSILARLWLSDYHVLFLPRSWEKLDGTLKNLKNKDNWVNLELLYGQFIQRELKLVAGALDSDSSIQAFRQHLREYHNEREIEQIDENEWTNFVSGAKERLDRILSTSRYLVWNSSGQPDEAFWLDFKMHVLDPAGRKLIHILFHAWCYFFGPEDWSVLQAILLQTGNPDREFTATELAEFIWQKKTVDGRFEWARSSHKLEALKEATRKRLADLAEFEFSLYEGGSFPILRVVKKRPLTVRLRIASLYNLLARKFDLKPNSKDLARIVKTLLEPRKA